MKKFDFFGQVAPHLVAIVVFLIVTITFFNPAFFDNKSLSQPDIQYSVGASKALRDYRDATSEEGLWAPNMFSGMPGYLVNVEWGYEPIIALKKILSLWLPHPICNIFLAFICYYIMLLVFRVRPYLAIIGALAFGLSSYMIIGIAAGHNARVGAIAFMPLVVAGIHLTFSGRRILGFGLTAMAMALHLRENHLQMTYYLLMIVVAYGIVQLVIAIREKRTPDFIKNIIVLVPAVLVAVGTFFGPFWAIEQYSAYSIRGKSEIEKPGEPGASGLPKSYAFEYSNAIGEPITLLIPNFYGGSTSDFLVMDQNSETYKALVEAADRDMVNQLARYSSSYWGPQSNAAPYYGGAIVCLLFVIGLAFAEKKYVWWLVPLSAVAIIMSWGNNFASFNYFLFDYLPVYNKFRSPTFTLIIVLFAMPLLGLLGLEQLMKGPLSKSDRKKLLISSAVVAGICLLFILFAGTRHLLRPEEGDLPGWFTSALRADRKELLRSDALRSLGFVFAVFILLYVQAYRRFSPIAFYLALGFFTVIDIIAVDRRYFNSENFQRRRAQSPFVASAADKRILSDTSYYRVLNLTGPFNEARTSYFHNSVGGYHGAKIRRYQDLYDSCLFPEMRELAQDAGQRKIDFRNYGVIDMLNIKYVVYGEGVSDIINNPYPAGSAWFAKEVKKVNTPLEELQTIGEVDTHSTAVVDQSKFNIPGTSYDSTSIVTLGHRQPNEMRYHVRTGVQSLCVFSEIYYPKGWTATIDGTIVEIMRANYVLRALVVPPGEHNIVFTFSPAAYTVGNKITAAASWILVLVVLAALAQAVRKEFFGQAPGTEPS